MLAADVEDLTCTIGLSRAIIGLSRAKKGRCPMLDMSPFQGWDKVDGLRVKIVSGSTMALCT